MWQKKVNNHQSFAFKKSPIAHFEVMMKLAAICKVKEIKGGRIPAFNPFSVSEGTPINLN